MWSHSVFRDTGVPMLMVAPSGRISAANPAAQELVGRRCLTGTDLGDLIAAPDRTLLDPFLGALATLPTGRSQALGPVRVEWRDEVRQVQLVGSRTRDPHGFDAFVVSVNEAAAPALAHLVELDPLTGVGTRQRGLRLLEAEVSPEAPGTLLVIDLDGFAEINAAFGDAEGDRMLVDVARRLVRSAPAGASVARLEGDMFLVASPGTPWAAAEYLARGVLTGLGEQLHIGGTRVLTASIGAARMAGSSAHGVLDRGLAALRVAKEQGGAQVVLDGPAMRTFGRRHTDLVALARIRELESEVAAAHADAARAHAEARTDPLTQLANMRAYEEQVSSLQARMRRTSSSTAVLFIDFDEFGTINRSLGQHRGNLALQACAAVLAGACRADDQLFRVGGEEFVALLPDSDLAAGLVVAERLRSAVESEAIPHWGRPDLPIVTISVGVAAGRGAQRTLAQLVIEANQEMGLAKERGRNQVSPIAPAEPEPGSAQDAPDVAPEPSTRPADPLGDDVA